LSQRPQCIASLASVRHAPAHSVCPAAHAHTPATHTPLAHALLQRPQCIASLWRLRHAPPHSTRPLAHSQVPPAQVWSLRHARPHAPQFDTSSSVLTQASPHARSPAPHI
jgi:hypothetical protein